MISLRARLLTAASLVLLAFVMVTGVALQRADEKRALLAQQNRMQGLVYALLGAMEVGADSAVSIALPALPDGRFSQPESGLYAVVHDHAGNSLWESPSRLGTAAATLPALGINQWRFDVERRPGFFTLGYGFRWHGESEVFHFVVSVGESADNFVAERREFTHRLWFWLLVPAALLLVLQAGVLVWALGPLRRMTRDVRAVESGHEMRLGTRYPRELQPLRNALNALLAAERTRHRRYRDALADLSHSLKTPLAAALNLAGNETRRNDRLLIEQLKRMRDIIGYQLKRAAAQNPAGLAAPVAVIPVARRLAASLQKVYAEKRLDVSIEGDDHCTARIAEDALFEALGALLDNAFKWSRRRVRTAIRCDGNWTSVSIGDDGPGFPPEHKDRLLTRGTRGDETREGQGIGLTVVQDILRQAGGELDLENGSDGGARVILRLPR
ncbi:MAG: ATP-binding protein [Pseudomonadota bacterium]